MLHKSSAELPDIIACTNAVSQHGRASQWQRALGVFDAMQDATLVPDVVAYSAAVSACEKGGQWQQALGRLMAMQEAHLLPNVFTYSAAISACEKGQQWQQGLWLLATMQDAQFVPNIVTYNAAISACDKGEQWQRALLLLANMQDARLVPDVISYSATISACASSGQWQRGLKQLAAMQAYDVVPNMFSYVSAISACEKAEHWQRAIGIVAEMQGARFLPNLFAYTAAIGSCKKTLRPRWGDDLSVGIEGDRVLGQWAATLELLDRRLRVCTDAGQGGRLRLRQPPFAPRRFISDMCYLGIRGLVLRQLLRACARPPRTSFRINHVKARPRLLDRLCSAGWQLSPVPWQGDSFFVQSFPRDIVLGLSEPHVAGEIYFQESTSMVPAEVLRAALVATASCRNSSRLRILDTCAAPGSKSTQLGSWLMGKGGEVKGVVVANEPNDMRAAKLRGNLLRAGLVNAVVSCLDGRDLGDLVPGRFDGVLVDVPCSCEGNVRKDPFALLQAPEEGLLLTQLALLKSSWQALRPGGCLVYSTCTFSPTENELNCKRFLDDHGDCARSLDIAELVGLENQASADALQGSVRLWPHRFDVEGFFVACFQKTMSPSQVATGLIASAVKTPMYDLWQLKTVCRADLAALKRSARDQFGFWPCRSDGDGNLGEDSEGKIWLVQELDACLQELASHVCSPGIAIAKRVHASYSESETISCNAGFEFSEDFIVLSGRSSSRA